MLVYIKNVLRYRKLGHILDLLTFIQRNVLLGKNSPRVEGFVGICAADRDTFKNGLPLLSLYVITRFGLNEVQFCLCMALSVKKF